MQGLQPIDTGAAALGSNEQRCRVWLTVQRHDAEDEDQRENKDNDGVDLESGRLISVKTEHCAAGTTGAGRPGAAGAHIGDLLLLVGRGTAADGCPRATGRRWRGRTAAVGTGRDGRADWG